RREVVEPPGEVLGDQGRWSLQLAGELHRHRARVVPVARAAGARQLELGNVLCAEVTDGAFDGGAQRRHRRGHTHAGRSSIRVSWTCPVEPPRAYVTTTFWPALKRLRRS